MKVIKHDMRPRPKGRSKLTPSVSNTTSNTGSRNMVNSTPPFVLRLDPCDLVPGLSKIITQIIDQGFGKTIGEKY